MRSANLAKVAFDAEILRYKYLVARQARRAAFGIVAFVFGLGFLTALEIALWQVIEMYVSAIYATLSILALNLVITAGFSLLAMRSSPGRTEIEALEVRNQAVTTLQKSIAFSALVPVATAVWRNRGRSRNAVAKRGLLR